MWKWNKVLCVLDSCTQLVVHHAFAIQVETQIGREGTFIVLYLSSRWTRSAFLSGAWVVILRESAESEDSLTELSPVKGPFAPPLLVPLLSLPW